MKIKLLTIAFFFGFHSAQAQFNVPQLTTPAPASPNATSLGRYGEIPVSLSTGVPSISIPLYEVKTGNISFPISLNYHAGGVKVEERASWVGLGWSLNSGGVITRVCRGVPDEYPSGFMNIGYKVGQYHNGMTPAQKQSYIEGIELGITDAEPDIFYYSFGNYSGKFCFTNTGEIMTAPRNNLKISYINQPNHGWEVTTPDGTRYLFNEAEITTSTPYFSNGGPQEDGTPVEMETSWYLKKITDINSNTVEFQYEDENYFFDTHKQYSRRVLQNPPISNPPPCPGLPGYIFNVADLQGKRLMSLTYANAEIDFIPSTSIRLDLSVKSLAKIQIKNLNEVLKEWEFNTSYSTSRLTLENIIEKSASTTGAKYIFNYNTTASLPVVTSFSEDYWGYFNGVNNNEFVKYNLANGSPGGANKEPNPFYAQANILEKITYPTGGTSQFEYSGNESQEWKPEHYGTPISITTLAGNNYGATSTIVDFQQVFTITSSQLSPADNLAHTLFSIGEAVGPNPTGLEHIVSYLIVDQNNTVVGNGTSIYNNNNVHLNLPAGSYTIKVHLETDYPGDPEVAFTASLDFTPYIPAGFQNTIVGGVRVDKITNKASENSIPEIKTFKYNLFGQTLTSGTSGGKPIYNFISEYQGTWYNGYGNVPYQCFFNSFSSAPQYPLSTTSGSPVSYGNVVTEYGTDAAGGKIESTFTTYNDAPDIENSNFPFPPPISHEYQRGSLLKETKYKKAGNSFIKVSEEENIYQTSGYNNNIKESEGLKIGRNMEFEQRPYFYAGLVEANYIAVGEIYNLQSKKTRIYNSANPSDYLETETEYNYSDTHFQPVQVTTSNSKGELQDVYMKYPHEMQSVSSPNVYNEMVTRHIWAPVIEQSVFKNSSTFLQSAKTNYNYWYNGSWGTNNTNSLILPQTLESKVLNNNSEIRGRYHSYDEKGNVRTVSKENDLKTTYLWGYNKAYPVAQIIGVDYSALSGLFNQSILDNPTDDNQLNTELNNLRSGLAGSNALITTYTYKPLVGMTTQTDPNGRISFFEYDALGRLAVIKDKDHNVIKKICYNYAGQPENCTSNCTNTTATWQNTTTALRCQQGSCGNTGYQEQEQQDINPCSSTFNQIQWVVSGYNPTACPLSCVNLTSTNTYNTTGYVASYYNTATAITYTFNVSTASGLQPLGTVPAGNYTLTISRPSGAIYSIFKSGCFKQTVAANSAIFYNVAVSTSTCNSITVTMSVEQ